MKARPSFVGILALALAASAAAQTLAPGDTQASNSVSSHDIGPLALYKMPVQPVEGSAVPSSSEDIRTLPTYRHPGLLIGNPFRLNESLAYQTFLRDDWNNTKDEYRNIAHAMALGGDAGEGRMIVKEVDDEDARMRADAESNASAPAMGRFAIASAETGTKLLELPEETIDFSLIRKTW
jgi:hypothetical protein